MKNLTENELNNTLCCGKHPFSDEVILWLYNENLYDNINLPCVVYLIILSVLGVFGNSLVIYIYGFIFKRTNAHFFILSLAVIDNICSIAMVFEVFDKRFPMYSGNYKVLCKITRITDVFGTVSSSMLLLCIALDRYYKICQPFKCFSYRKARISLMISVGLGALLSWPMGFFHGPETVETGVKNVVGSDCGDDDNFKHSILPTIYFGTLGVLNMIVIVLLSYMYIRIFRAIVHWKREQIGETIVPSSPLSVVSMNYKLSRVLSWIKNSRKNKYRDSIDSDNQDDNQGNGTSLNECNDNLPNGKYELTHIGNGTTKNGVATGHHYTRHIYDHVKSQQNSQYTNRRNSTFSNSSGRRSFKNSRIVTTNTVSFSIVTIIYIISYLPTICVETLNASGVYIEQDLTNRTRSIIVIFNVSYFLNNVVNQFVYSAINPAYREQVRKLFTGP